MVALLAWFIRGALSDFDIERKIIDKIKKIGIPFGDYVNGKIFRGILSGYNKAFVIDASTK